VSLECDLLLAPLGGFLERKRYLTPHIAAAPYAPAAATPPTAAEDVAEDIAERREDVFNVGKVPCPAVAIDARVAVPVVPPALLRVVQHLKRLAAFLEAREALLIPRVLVRVILHGKLAIRRGDLRTARRALNAEDFVITTFGRHGSTLTVRAEQRPITRIYVHHLADSANSI
jgi:hypothetical protein